MPQKVKEKSTALHHAKYTRVKSTKLPKKDPESTEIIKALQQNNASLATALDETRQELRDVHDSFVKLQAERQLLLERVVTLESKLSDQQKISYEQVRPVVNLLEQTEQNLRVAKRHLQNLFQERHSSGCHGNPFPPFFSPISGLTTLQPESKIPSISCDSNIAQQASPNTCPSEPTSTYPGAKGKAKFPKTPHPAVGPKLSSTPDCIQGQSFESFVCEPKAINFDQEDSAITVNQTADTPLPTSLEPQDLLTEFTAENNLSVVAECSRSNKKENISSLGLSSDMADSMQSKRVGAHAGQRPRRTCTSMNISYQEPSLKSKLRRGGPEANENISGEVSSKPKAKQKQLNSTTIPKIILQDITNRKN